MDTDAEAGRPVAGLTIVATRRTFLSLCAAAAATITLPVPLRLRALSAYAATSFSFSAHQRAVLTAAANTVVPGGSVRTRQGPRTVPSAGEAGAVDFIENLLSGAVLFAAGTRRPPYVPLPPGVSAPLFPAAGTLPLWASKRAGWFGDLPRPPLRPEPWPSELLRLQRLYRAGVLALDAAASPLTFDTLPEVGREAILRQLHAQEANAYDGQGEGRQPFFLTFLDHMAQACFGDPVYGGNREFAYWEMIGHTGPSFINAGGPGPGQGWTAEQMTGPFRRG